MRILYHFLLSLCGLLMAIPAYSGSVSVSDNLLVLSNEKRSGEIELLSMDSTPKEFTLELGDLPDSVKNGEAYLRWAPSRIIVPGNRGRPLRAVFRPNSDLAPGEYVVRLLVKSVDVNQEASPSSPDNDDQASEPGVGANIGIQPVLPVTVYLRHQVASPDIQLSDFTPTPNDPDRFGVFTATKASDAISFIGYMTIEHQQTGQTLSSGRLHIPQTVDKRVIQVGRVGDEISSDDTLCLNVWAGEEVSGEPDHTSCNG